MSRRLSRLDPADDVGDVGVDPDPVSGMTIGKARRAAAEMGGLAIQIPSMNELESAGLSFKGKGINVGRGILILCANASIEVEAAARQKLSETQDPEMFAKIATVHTQCVGQLLKNAELQMTQLKTDDTPLNANPTPKLEPMP